MSCDNSETVRDRMSVLLLLITNRKSHKGFRLIPSSMTLNELERRYSPYFAFSAEFDSFVGQLLHSGLDRPIMFAKYWLPVPVFHLAARSLCDSWASCPRSYGRKKSGRFFYWNTVPACRLCCAQQQQQQQHTVVINFIMMPVRVRVSAFLSAQRRSEWASTPRR